MGHSSAQDQNFPFLSPNSPLQSGRNVLHLLERREICPRTRHVRKWRWGQTHQSNGILAAYFCRSEPSRDPKRGLLSWAEAESMRHLSAKYCPLLPPPRSTIAAAFSPDGRTLASTHGDHTVKIIDCQSGNCMKVLQGHRRTPWVVRFHPRHPNIVASGSLDFEVRLWDANSAECIGSRDFYRPIASIAFHAGGELLAVASGHKLYIWHYNKRDEGSSPFTILKTRRSLRAVHFHPLAAPFLLTAEVNDLDSTDSSITLATTPGYMRYARPGLVTNLQSSDRVCLAAGLPSMPFPFFVSPSIDNIIDATEFVDSATMWAEASPSFRVPSNAHATGTYDTLVSAWDTFPGVPFVSYHNATHGGMPSNLFPAQLESGAVGLAVGAMEANENFHGGGNQQLLSTASNTPGGMLSNVPGHIPVWQRSSATAQLHQFLPSRDQTWWEFPFLQGWLLGQNQASAPSAFPIDGGVHQSQFAGSALPPFVMSHVVEAPVPFVSMSGSTALFRSSFAQPLPRSNFLIPQSVENIALPLTVPHENVDTQPFFNRLQSEIATSFSAATPAELPCTVKLSLWSHSTEHTSKPLSAESCRLTIPHAVLCSEMGAHFSPCGRYLAACVACLLPHQEAVQGFQGPVYMDVSAASSPNRHPVSARQVMYELRIYSIEEATFGSVLVSRAIRAAHCLTSIQFSPTSEHILLAYGRRHGSLFKSIVIDDRGVLPDYTILEVYRVSDMELVRVLLSAEDEVNVACYHPFAGGGLVYGTKEGKLCLLQCDSHGVNIMVPNTIFRDSSFSEVHTFAQEDNMLLVCGRGVEE